MAIRTKPILACEGAIVALGLVTGCWAWNAVAQSATNIPPTIRDVGPAVIREGETVQLTADIYDPDSEPPFAYLWRLPDGSFSMNASPEVHVNSPGVVSVELWVADAFSESLPLRKDIIVSNVPPSITALGPAEATEGEEVLFSAVVLDQGDRERHQYEWTLPDTSVSSLVTPPWAFGEPGQYSLALVVKELGWEWVYNNSRDTGPRVRYYQGTNEAGDELILGGTNRIVSQFELVLYASLTNLTLAEKEAARARVRLYAADGPKVTSKQIPSPGTLLFESVPFGIEEGYHWKTFRGLNLDVPDVVIWTLSVENLPQTAGKSAGMVFYNSTVTNEVDVGRSYDDFWKKKADGSWALFRVGGNPVANFGCRVLCKSGQVIGQSDFVTQTVTVSNMPPVLVGANAPENGLIGSELAFSATASDVGGGDLTYEWSFGDQGAAQGQEVRHTYGAEGTYAVILTVRDRQGAQTQTNLSVVITADLKALRFSSAPVTRVNEDEPYACEIQTITPGVGQTLRLLALTLPNWLTITDRGDGTGLLQGAPGQAQVGAHLVDLQLTDGTSSVNQTFTLEVLNVNDPPTIQPLADQTIRSDRTLGPLTVLLGDPDNPATELSVTAQSSDPALVPPGGFQFLGVDAERRLWIQPAAQLFGTTTITLTVSDVLSTASTSFQLTVTPATRHTLTLAAAIGGSIAADPMLAEYEDQAAVLLTAQPIAGYAFAGWGGDASGTVNPLRLLMDSPKVVSAAFSDAAGPAIQIASPAPGPRETDVYDFAGTVADNVGVASVEWQRDGVAQGALALTDGAFSVTGLRLSRGEHRLGVLARDAAGNQSVAEVVLSWAPGIVLTVVSPAEQREGKTITVPLKLTSQGEINGMDFTLTYDAPYLGSPELIWSSRISLGQNAVNYDVPGQITASFALEPNTTIPAGVQDLGVLKLRVRSLPFNLNSYVDANIDNANDVNGLPVLTGMDTLSGMARLLKRRITGDMNGNDRLDVNDANLLSLMVVEGIAPDRAWDLGLNDLNKNNRLDSGDVAQVMRVVAGLDPQPQPQWLEDGGAGDPALLHLHESINDGVSLHAGPVARAVVVAPVTSIRGGQQFTVQIRLEDVIEPITGASFKLLYPVDALRLARANAYRPGAVVPSSAQKVWNSKPDLGSIGFAASGTNAWPSATGVLAEFDFEVLASVPDESGFALQITNLELAKAGYGLTQFDVPLANLESAVQYPPSRIESFVLGPGGQVDLRLAAEAGQKLLLEASSDLVHWTPYVTLPGSGLLRFTDPTLTGAPQRFFRVRGYAPAGTVPQPVAGDGR